MSLISRLLTATALVSVLAATASGAENYANVHQSGATNSGLVTQTGMRNDVGLETDSAKQTGNQNAIIFTQSGNDNAVGTLGTGFLQTSNRNSTTITQNANGNVVGQVTQTGIGSSLGGATLRRNTLTIAQDSAGEAQGNSVGLVSQTRNPSLLTVSQAANSATLTQTGSGNVIGSTGPTLAGVVQSGYGQSATITQTGDGNVVTGTEQVGSRNSLQLTFNGNGNGTTPFATSNAPVGAWGNLTQGRVRQSNDFFGAGILTANSLVFTVGGDRNSFGFDQEGSDNAIVGTIEIGGDDNQTGVIQLGAVNDATFSVDGDRNKLFIHQGLFAINAGNTATATIDGDDNIAALRQSGGPNLGTVAVTGNTNKVNLTQESALLPNLGSITISGDLNDVTLTQSGANTAEVGITGNGNFLMASQTGLANELSIGIFGSNTNKGNFTQLKPAAVAAGTLLPGTVTQNGTGNSISYGIGDSGDLTNDRNLFAFSQTGSGNGIVGTTSGDNNEVAIIQTGNDNFTSFNQIGNGNVIGVMQ